MREYDTTERVCSSIKRVFEKCGGSYDLVISEIDEMVQEWAEAHLPSQHRDMYRHRSLSEYDA
jgi:predicted SpoU family rRNA methylase